MFELPLHLSVPPTEPHSVVRPRVSREINPKRRFASVLTTSGSTVDGIHLPIWTRENGGDDQQLLGQQISRGSGHYRQME